MQPIAIKKLCLRISIGVMSLVQRTSRLWTRIPSRARLGGVMDLVSRARALSPVRADLIPSPKRVRDSGYLADVEVDPRETSLRDDVIAKIDECFAYADALRDRGIDARVVVEAVDREESEISVRGPIEVRVERVMHPEMPEDIPEPAQEGAVEVTYETLGDLVQRFHDHTEFIVYRKMPNTRSGASMTHEEVEELVTRRNVRMEEIEMEGMEMERIEEMEMEEIEMEEMEMEKIGMEIEEMEMEEGTELETKMGIMA
ncbi:hypothetical protein Tco_0597248 [Tanacetum coccineum]